MTTTEADRPPTPDPSPPAGQEPQRTGQAQQKRVPPVRFLSQMIDGIPKLRRLAFINDLKAAIRKGQFDGGPLDDTFKLNHEVRGKAGPVERDTEHREFAVENNAAFQAWYELHLKLVKKTSGLPTKFEIEGGHVSLHDLATKFRRRKGSKPRARGKAKE